MSSFSPGFLYSAFKLLSILSAERYDLHALASALPRIEIRPAIDVVNFSIRLGWVMMDEAGYAVLSESAKSIIESKDHPSRMRLAIKDHINVDRPAWAQLIPRGRSETLSVLSPEVRQCFFEAGLETDFNDTTVEWWDRFADIARGKKARRQTSIGRAGERLTIEFETRRTGEKPLWQAVETNLAGYDVLSRLGKSDDDRLMIEVKTTSTSIEFGRFHVTRHEWETCRLAGQYQFYLWVIGEGEPLLARLVPDQIGDHLPADNGDGKWESTVVPFLVFQDLFRAQVEHLH